MIHGDDSQSFVVICVTLLAIHQVGITSEKNNSSKDQAWYAEFLIEINLKILLRKTGERLIFKIAFMSLHIAPGASFTKLVCVSDVTFGNFLIRNTYNFVQQCNSFYF
jgi:hypothetical protein